MHGSKLFAAILALALAAPAIAADEAGVFKIPGTETTLKLNGFIEMDVAYDLKGSDDDIRGNDWAAFLPVQPLDNDVFTKAQPNRLYMTARTSRIGFTTTTPTKNGPLVTRVEGDFNDPSAFNYSTEITTNGTNFRIRHAYGEYRGLLLGQTWSNFMDLDSLTDTVEFNGHGAFASIRTAMIRYTLKAGPGTLSLSVENPQSFVANGQNVSGTVGRRWDRFPTGTASLTVPFKMGHVNLRGMAFEYNNLNAANKNTSATAWGLGASGSLKFGPETLVWSVQGGQGIGHYMFETLFQGALLVNDKLALWKALGYHVGLTHAWSPKLRSNLIWTQTFIDGSNALIDTAVADIDNTFANKRMDVAYVNTFHSPFKGFEYGLEYEWGQRKIFERVAAGGEDTGTMSRINALFRYTFF